MSEPASDRESAHLLTVFALDDALFGVDALRVQEIIRVGTLTPVHHAPAYVLGIINLRGHIVTVLDPAERMGLPPQQRTDASRILILEGQDEPVGLMVERVVDMVLADTVDVTPTPSNLRQRLSGYLLGMQRYREHMVSILDLRGLLGSDGSL